MYDDNFLMHHGVKGQKWGVRNYQNPDGTLTEAGRKRYLNDPTGKFDRIKSILSTGGKKVSSGIRRYASNKKEAFIRKHKPASQMSDAELNENLNRMRKEQELKRMRDEMSGKKPKQSFAQKHPILQQVFVSTATSVASDLVKKQLNTKLDEILAPKRMERAKKNGLLDEKLMPFMSKENAGRNVLWNKSQAAQEEREKGVRKRIDESVANAVSEERKGHQGNLERAVEAAKRQVTDELLTKHESKLHEVAQNAQREGLKAVQRERDARVRNMKSITDSYYRMGQRDAQKALERAQKDAQDALREARASAKKGMFSVEKPKTALFTGLSGVPVNKIKLWTPGQSEGSGSNVIVPGTPEWFRIINSKG